MIKISPFRAVRPKRDVVSLVASRSYLTYSDDQLGEKLENNPYTFLHVIHPDTKAAIRAEGREKFEMVKDKFNSFREDGIFTKDENESLYLYQQRTHSHVFIGIIAAVSVNDYLEGRILVHEHTLTQREEMFKDYLHVTGFNAEPVLLMYPESGDVNQVIGATMDERPDYEFTTTDRVSHYLWKIDKPSDIEVIQNAFNGMDKIYIADGHHRSASSALLGQQLSSEGKSGPFESFMAYLIPENSIHIHGFHRLVKSIGLDKSKFLEKLKTSFIVSDWEGKGYQPDRLHEIGMYLNGHWYTLNTKPGSFDPEDPVTSLDAEILSRNVLNPILGITDLRNDPRVDFLPGDKGCEAIEKAVDSGKYECGFALFAVTTEQLKSVADASCIMPPKSTYIEPKLRSGLTIYELFEK